MEVVLDLHLHYDRSRRNTERFHLLLPRSQQSATAEPGTRFSSDHLHPDRDIARAVLPHLRTSHRTKSSSSAHHEGRTKPDQDGLVPNCVIC